MNEDFTSALHGFADALQLEAEASAPDATIETSALTRRVRRRRGVRTGSTVLSAVAVIGAATVVVQLSGLRMPPPPAVPVPTVTSTPTPTPSATPTPTVSATAAPRPAAAMFRDAQPMAPGMLAAAGDGWNVVLYGAWDEQNEVVVPEAPYLVSPDGQPFAITTGFDFTDWSLVDWLPGSSLALVSNRKDQSVRAIDLLTGDTHSVLVTGGEPHRFVGDETSDVLVLIGDGVTQHLSRLTIDGDTVARSPDFAVQYGSFPWFQSPGGADIVLNGLAGPVVVTADALTPETLPMPYPDRPDACRAWMWVDDTNLLLECTPGGASELVFWDPTEFWLVPTDSGAARRLDGMPESTRLAGVWRVDGRLVAGMSGPSEAESSWYEIADDGLHRLSSGGSRRLGVVDVRGSELIGTQWPEPGTTDAVSLVAIDPVTGESRTLVVGEPASTASFGVRPGHYTGPPQTQTGD
ncbi:hypothetical protein [Cellulomonas sp. URHD0024]|uniref:hypothetical protein n=1 Tax=Cellulomonas sp. URHD0024 TaxID=1302620 RepID=UPI0004118300|nr:hypothetical protein [Cellulomonas sp. URHD0024]